MLAAQIPTRLPRPARVVYLLVVLDLSAFGLILPSLPFHAESYGATGLGLGLLLAAYSAAKLVGAPILGRISDRTGRRPIMVFGLCGSTVALLMAGAASDLTGLTAALAVAGLLACSVSTAQAVIADLTEPKERARHLGLLGAAIGTGFIVGPATGVVLARYSFGAVAGTGAMLAAAAAGLAFFTMPESLLRGRPPGTWLSIRGVFAALGRPQVSMLLVTSYLATFAFVAMETTFAYFGARRYGLDERGFGAVLVFVGVIVIIVQGGIIGRVVPRFGERRVAVLGCVLLGGSLASVPVAPNLGLTLAALGLLAVGRGLVSPAVASLLSRHSPASEQGRVLGLGESLSAAARATGPLLAGWLYDLAPALPYTICGVLALVAALAVATVADPA